MVNFTDFKTIEKLGQGSFSKVFKGNFRMQFNEKPTNKPMP